MNVKDQVQNGKPISYMVGPIAPFYAKVTIKRSTEGHFAQVELTLRGTAWVMSPETDPATFQRDVWATLRNEYGKMIFNVEFFDGEGNRLVDGLDRLAQDVTSQQ